MQKMAPSKLIALFIAFAVVAATLRLCEARVQGFKTAAVDQEASEPAVAADHEVSERSSKVAAGGGGFPGFPPLPGMPQIPGFPLPLPQIPGFPSFPPLFGFHFPPLPQIPGFPRFPPLFGPLPGAPGSPPSQALPGLPTSPPISFPSLPGTPPSPTQPAECSTPLTGLMPCMDYLTNITVPTPLSTCCDGFKSVVNNAPICLCHGMNSGMNQLFPKPIDPIRMLILPARCGTMVPIQTFFTCFTQPVPPLTPPSSPAPPVPPQMAPSSPAPASSPVSPP